MRQAASSGRSRALRFVLLIGIMSFFADATYEGARGILGPYLAILGASGAAVGVVTGFGELLGYGLRLVSGRTADATRQFWPITIFGYVIQMAAVPALALAGAAVWGLGIGVHESIIPAAVAPMVPLKRRASSYGLFTAGYGTAWFLGSAAIGVLYDHSIPATVAFCVALELAAIPFFVQARRRLRLTAR